MHNTYNIYSVKHAKLDELLEKISGVGLKAQKTIKSEKYSMAFFFSENIAGNEVWWWKTYREFFNDDVKEPKNKFNFALLLCTNTEKPETIYAVSLGKSHFFLSKFIEADFGINLAVRMADENTILLKKSRYFAGSKRQEIASYQDFLKDNYEPGESVDHLKLKATDKETWGDKNMIFADSIQMDRDMDPRQLTSVFDHIDQCMNGQEIINLPKLEPAPLELLDFLDKLVFSSIREMKGSVTIEEFEVQGVNISFNFHNYSYQLSSKNPDQKTQDKVSTGNSLEIFDIHKYLVDHPYVDNLDLVRVQFKSEDNGKFTKGVKDVIDFYAEHEGNTYFLRSGEWYKFNQTFMTYLKRSLDSIITTRMGDLDENEYLRWKADKLRKIANNEETENKITYREYYFNKWQSDNNGYILLDRELEAIKSLEKGNKNYKFEVADLFKDKEIISVKISEDNHELIYNVEQSRGSVDLIKRGVIPFDHDLEVAALWFVFENEIERITQQNSIQFLLAVEAWQKRVKYHNLTPKIYISLHINKPEKKELFGQ